MTLTIEKFENFAAKAQNQNKMDQGMELGKKGKIRFVAPKKTGKLKAMLSKLPIVKKFQSLLQTRKSLAKTGQNLEGTNISQSAVMQSFVKCLQGKFGNHIADMAMADTDRTGKLTARTVEKIIGQANDRKSALAMEIKNNYNITRFVKNTLGGNMRGPGETDMAGLFLDAKMDLKGEPSWQDSLPKALSQAMEKLFHLKCQNMPDYSKNIMSNAQLTEAGKEVLSFLKEFQSLCPGISDQDKLMASVARYTDTIHTPEGLARGLHSALVHEKAMQLLDSTDPQSLLNKTVAQVRDGMETKGAMSDRVKAEIQKELGRELIFSEDLPALLKSGNKPGDMIQALESHIKGRCETIAMEHFKAMDAVDNMEGISKAQQESLKQISVAKRLDTVKVEQLKAHCSPGQDLRKIGKDLSAGKFDAVLDSLEKIMQGVLPSGELCIAKGHSMGCWTEKSSDDKSTLMGEFITMALAGTPKEELQTLLDELTGEKSQNLFAALRLVQSGQDGQQLGRMMSAMDSLIKGTSVCLGQSPEDVTFSFHGEVAATVGNTVSLESLRSVFNGPQTSDVPLAELEPGSLEQKEAVMLNQCMDLTRKIEDSTDDSLKPMHARMFAALLPGMQSLAKKSMGNFLAYRNMMDAAQKNGLLDGKVLGRPGESGALESVMDFRTFSPSQTLGIAKAVTEYASVGGNWGQELKTRFLSESKSLLAAYLSQGTTSPEKAHDDEGGQKKQLKAFWDKAVTQMKTDLKKAKPGTPEGKSLRKTLLAKYEKQGSQNITERDFEKMGPVLGDQHTVLNMAILARYVLKNGEVKTTEYTPQEIKAQVKEQIKTTLEQIKNTPRQDRISNLEGVRAVAETFRKGDMLDPEKLSYLKNKLKTKLNDYLPDAGNDPWVNRMNKAIREEVQKDLFIAPEKMKYRMLDISGSGRKIGAGGGDAVIYTTATKSGILKQLKYSALTRQLEALTRGVNSSSQLAFKCFMLGDDDKMQKAQREMKISKELDHPNIVKTYFGVKDLEGNRLGMVMEYCKKGDFLHVLKEDANPSRTGERKYDPNTPEGVKHIAEIVLKAVKGLHHMHQLGYVHRDMKLENIFMTEDGTPKIGDFGMTKKLGVQIQDQSSEYIGGLKDDDVGTGGLGTPTYMPQEVTTGNYYAGPAQDAYSMGMTALSAMFGGDENKITGPKKSAGLFEKYMAIKNKAEEKIQEWLKDPVFTKTEEGKKMKTFIEKSLLFNPEDRIGYDDSVSILNGIIKG